MKWQLGLGNQFAHLKYGESFLVPERTIQSVTKAASPHPIGDQKISPVKKLFNQKTYVEQSVEIVIYVVRVIVGLFLCAASIFLCLVIYGCSY